MAYVNVLEWRAQQVAEWLQGKVVFDRGKPTAFIPVNAMISGENCPESDACNNELLFINKDANFKRVFSLIKIKNALTSFFLEANFFFKPSKL